MQPNVPFRLIEVLATSRIGRVWAGVDPAGRQVTVAVLDEGVAVDPGWRTAFETAVRTMTQPDGGPMPIVGADFAPTAPWVAVLVDGGPGAARVFQNLGAEVDYWPVNPPAAPAQPGTANIGGPSYGPQASFPADPTPVHQAGAWPTMPHQSDPPAASPSPVSAAPASPLPVSAAPASPPPASPPPASPPPASAVPAQPPWTQPWNTAQPAPYNRDPLVPPLGDVSRPRRRKGLWAAVAVIVLALAGGATAVVLTVRKDGKTPVAQESTAASSGPVIPTPSARQPGLEPPRVGDWPRWPVFGPPNNPQPHPLDGTGLTLALPSSWTCTRAATDEGATRYNCGAATNNGDEVGGEITVRTCEKPCTTERRDEMRKVEEAWGQQWRYAGEYAVIAETKTVNGSARYGLVVVAFWRSTPDDAVDRQLVFRMTAPQAWTDDIRKVANAAKTAAKF